MKIWEGLNRRNYLKKNISSLNTRRKTNQCHKWLKWLVCRILFWRLTHFFLRGCKLISEEESLALLSCSLYRFLFLAVRMELQYNTWRKVVLWQGSMWWKPFRYLTRWLWIVMWGDRERRCFFESSELFWNIQKDFSVFTLFIKEENLCLQYIPIMSDYLSVLNMNCICISEWDVSRWRLLV